MGATVGSVIPTEGAIIPAAVGVDIGCGMAAQRTTLTAADLPDNLLGLRSEIERRIPHGRTNNGKAGDRGAWGDLPGAVGDGWRAHAGRLGAITAKHPKIARAAERAPNHLGTLGTGNHFVEVCLDEAGWVWIMLHSGSRGIGNRIGSYFITRAKEKCGGGSSTCPTRTWPISPRGRTTSTTISRRSAGPRPARAPTAT